ncbi:DUF5751 family protein [Sulfolobus acidocaldarius]|uniref:Conserved protein n=5 Tax=Sulfolobus acidocaldarius TaxID=2285 RepID=Q4JA32_SULAC|nr:DUF5751 family protein [Sulfolobus acidocaldarius]AAY80348.1 conserved protein [Sulfolobus acidocaldarius DSM 639]AGE70929.1 hypothetical protein SacN8_04790 [Sulfolobus acidocaldarius N8]AGE73200.1 hypothetical protein SacRon12I_04780 [Sulfolobus acidocaldarius Ron12/I]ALU28765.1 hypothetical protein ATY89_01515 [Sulfolobus acidocaldarius]ALU31485.1 hypothetical protein ATZ20_04550 [Sulfolobus acidocaldarius]
MLAKNTNTTFMMANLMPYSLIASIVNVTSENLDNFFRRVLTDVRKLGSKKVVVNIITDLKFHEVVGYIREAMLDNIDIGYELHLWKRDEVNKMLDKLLEYNIDGILIYCDEETRPIMIKIYDAFPNKIKAMITKNYCVQP